MLNTESWDRLNPHIFTALYYHMPLYRTPIFSELFHRIPITAIKHTNFGIDSILINVRNHTINGIISLHKFFLLKIFFPTSILCLLTIAYIILNITPAINGFQHLFQIDKSVKKWLYQINRVIQYSHHISTEAMVYIKKF